MPILNMSRPRSDYPPQLRRVVHNDTGRALANAGGLTRSTYSMSTPECVLITGYSGFVGRHLLPVCREHFPDAALVGTSHLPIMHEETALRLNAVQTDLRNRDQVRQLIHDSRPNLIIHLAGQA